MAFFQGKTLWINQLTDGVADLHFGGPGQATSLLQPALLTELDQALDALSAAETFRLLIIHLGKSGKIALSLDLDAMARLQTAEEWHDVAQRGQILAKRFAEFRLPTIAMIAGSCSGPDLQFALACDYRVILEKQGMQLGFPELELGLMPFWGATHRLPRLMGLEETFRFLMPGRRLRPTEALSLGLVDAVTIEGDDPPSFLAEPQKQKRAWLPKRTWRQWFLESIPVGRGLLYRGAYRVARRRYPEDMRGPAQTIEAIRQGLKKGPAEAERMEREGIAQVGTMPAWRNLLNLHRQRETVRVEFAPRDRKERVRKLGIIGVDGRGGALTVLAATRNCQVMLQEKDDLTLGMALIYVLNLFEQELTRGNVNAADVKRNMNAIKATTNFRDFHDLELVVTGGDEPVEKLGPLLRSLESKVSDQTLLATTNPAVNVEQLVSFVTKPERLALLHFQAPAGRSLVVEVAPSKRMPEDKVRRLMEWVAHLGRTPRRVPDGPGLLLNRLLVPYFLESILLVMEGIRIDHIDEAMTSFGMLHGPFEHMDLMGVDNVAALVNVLTPTWEGRIPVDDSLHGMIGKKWLGQKTQLGFYRYRKRPVLHYHVMNEMRDRGRRERPQFQDVLSRTDQKKKVIERLAYLWIAEAARCLEEGYVNDAMELDLTLTFAGWAPHHGGPLTYARTIGKDAVLERLSFLEQLHGVRYHAVPWLIRWLDEAR